MFRLLFLFLLTAFPARADLFNERTFTLSNGMKVIVVENRRAPVVTHMVWYKTGSIDDPAGKSGVAHLLEHMMFKGTKTVPDGEFSKIVARNGGEENAFTSYDYTAYYQNIARDRLELVMFLESDRMKNLRFDERDFAPELEVVREERLMRTENNPSALLAEKRNAALWGEHPYGRPVIGFRQELPTLTPADIRAFYKKHYTPDNAILVVAGDIDADELKPLAEKYYGRIPPSRKAVAKRQFPISVPAKTKIEFSHPLAHVRTVSRTFPAPSYTSDGNPYAYAVLAEVLDAEPSGPMHAKLTETKKATTVSAYYNGFALDKGSFTLFAAAADGTDLTDIEAVFDKGFSVRHKDVERAKERLVSGMEFLTDDPQTTANVLGKAAVLGLDASVLEQWPEKIAAVTIEDVRAAWKKLMSSPFVTTFLTPEKKQ